MTVPEVSVIVPTYNHGRYVLESLASVFGQTYRSFEVIVVNDGSPDNTAEVLKPLVEAGRIYYIEQPNAGQASARNRGFASARGEYIAFLDDDDLWPADKLSWQVGVLKAEPDLGLIAGRAVLFSGNPSEIRELRPREREITFESLFRKNPISSPGQVLLRRSAVMALDGFNHDLAGVDDLDLYMRLSRISRLRFDSRLGLLYRQHPLNASNDTMRMLNHHRKVIERNLPFLSDAQRDSLQAEAYSLLYNAWGTKILKTSLSCIRRGRIFFGMSRLVPTVVFFLRLPNSRHLRRRIVKDIIPRRRGREMSVASEPDRGSLC